MKKIKLSQGYYALVDDEDFEYLNQWKWYARVYKHTVYACRLEKGKPSNERKSILMHRFLLNSKDCTDHIDANGLNNQRSNLRECTIQQNNFNRKINKKNKSGYKGVYFYKITKKWVAAIKVNYKKHHLGYFKTKEEAALAYNKAAIKYFGEFAYLNNI